MMTIQVLKTHLLYLDFKSNRICCNRYRRNHCRFDWFDGSGTIISGNNTINFTSKSINQFFGCTGITEAIDATNEVRSEVFVYGFSNGDPERKVTIRLTGVLNDFVEIDTVSLLEKGKKLEYYLLEKILKSRK